MADGEKNIEKKMSEIIECSICFKPFTDPRMLPCIHTFCFECLRRTSDSAKKKPGEMLPCPLCRKEFSIPEEGMTGLQKNFFMDNLIEVKKMVHMSKTSNVCCDVCSEDKHNRNGKDVPEATQRCLECQQNLCDSCSAVHNMLKLTKSHTVTKIENTNEEELTKRFPTRNCDVHTQKPLDYYCTQCKKVVCVSCFVENHSLHGCKDVITMDTKFREIIQKNSSKLSDYAQEIFDRINLVEQRKANFLNNISEVENAILVRNKEIKELIERETECLLKELSSTKEEYLKKLQLQNEEMEANCVALQNLEIYSSELISKGSASDICCCVDEILKRFDEIERDHDTASCRWPNKTLKVSFSSVDTPHNLVGQIKSNEYTTSAFLIGIDDGPTITKDVIKLDLHGYGISYTKSLPTPEMSFESSAAVYHNSIFVVGTGFRWNEIWKHGWTSGWIQCASLVEGRSRHSVAFVDEVLYICGGTPVGCEKVLGSVEGYNVNTNRCSTVGKLVCGVQSAGNCVSFKNALYIFGGSDEKLKDFNHVQQYDTKQNICTLLSQPMPKPYRHLRAALWHTFVILLGYKICYIFNLEEQKWEERKQFKTDVDHFGLVLEGSRIVVIGGGKRNRDVDGKVDLKCRDDVRYVPVMDIIENKQAEWKVLARLPKPCLVHCYAKV